jgi:hypothetical protein
VSTSNEDDDVEAPVGNRGQQQQEFYGEIIGMNLQNEARRTGLSFQESLDNNTPISSPSHTPLTSVSSSTSNQPPTSILVLDSISNNESNIIRSNVNSSTSLIYDDTNDFNSTNNNNTDQTIIDNVEEDLYEDNDLNSEILEINEEFDVSDNGSDYDGSMSLLRENCSLDIDNVLRRRNKVVHNSDI